DQRERQHPGRDGVLAPPVALDLGRNLGLTLLQPALAALSRGERATADAEQVGEAGAVDLLLARLAVGGLRAERRVEIRVVLGIRHRGLTYSRSAARPARRTRGTGLCRARSAEPGR